MAKVKLFPIDKDYLTLIGKINKEGDLFHLRVMGAAGYKSLDRLVKAGKIEHVARKSSYGHSIGGYRIKK